MILMKIYHILIHLNHFWVFKNFSIGKEMSLIDILLNTKNIKKIDL